MITSPVPAADAAFPVFDTSDFAGGQDVFYFDVVRLEDRDDIPRGFLHRHNYYHLLWMTRASGVHVLDFQQFPVRDRSVFLLSPGQMHAWSSSVKPYGFVINISTAFFAQMCPRAEDIVQFPFFDPTRDAPVLDLSSEQHDELLPLLEEIEKESLARQPGSYDVVRSYLLILLIRLRRLCPPDERGAASAAAHTLAKRFLVLVEQHYLQFDTIGRYARALHVSERQLNDTVKRAIGRTASLAVQERVALEAKRLLSNTELGIAEIGFQLNFEDPAYFARFFKKHAGLAPGEFRKKYAVPLG